MALNMTANLAVLMYPKLTQSFYCVVLFTVFSGLVLFIQYA